MELVAPENFDLDYQISRPGTVPIFSMGSNSSPIEYLFSDKEEHRFKLKSRSLGATYMCLNKLLEQHLTIEIIADKRPITGKGTYWFAQASLEFEPAIDLFFCPSTDELLTECNKIQNEVIRKAITDFIILNLDFISTI